MGFSWILLALLAPLLWACVNHIDKYLLSTHFKGNNVGALMLFSTLIAVPLLPVMFALNPSALGMKWEHIALLLGVGILGGLAVWLYLHALDEEEASIIVPLFQTTPIFGFIFAFFLLGETITPVQFVGCLLIITGSVIITLEFDEERHVRLKKKVAFLMLGSAAIFGLYETIFKVVAIEEPFWSSIFWQHVGLLIVGLCLLFVTRFRKRFFSLIKEYGVRITALNVGSELLTILGNVITSYVLLLAPVVLVLVITGIQPMLVFLVGIILTFLFPHIIRERTSTWHLVHKASAILIMFIGMTMIQY